MLNDSSALFPNKIICYICFHDVINHNDYVYVIKKCVSIWVLRQELTKMDCITFMNFCLRKQRACKLEQRTYQVSYTQKLFGIPFLVEPSSMLHVADMASVVEAGQEALLPALELLYYKEINKEKKCNAKQFLFLSSYNDKFLIKIIF